MILPEEPIDRGPSRESCVNECPWRFTNKVPLRSRPTLAVACSFLYLLGGNSIFYRSATVTAHRSAAARASNENAQAHCESGRVLFSFQTDCALAMPSAVRTTPIPGQGVLSPSVMGSGAYVASPISRFICMEVVKALCPALR